MGKKKAPATKNENKKELTPIPQLFQNSLFFLKKNFSKIIIIILITLLPFIILQILIDELNLFIISAAAKINFSVILMTAFLLIASIATFILPMIQFISLIYLIDRRNKSGEEFKLKEIHSANKNYFFPYLWISFLMIILMTIGLLLPQIPFKIISSFIFLFPSSKALLTILLSISLLASWVIILYFTYLFISFSFSYFILICEDIKGLQAIKKSKQIIKTHWWKVFLRLILLSVIFLDISFLIFKFTPKNIYNYIVSLYLLFVLIFAIPFTLIYTYYIYRDIR